MIKEIPDHLIVKKEVPKISAREKALEKVIENYELVIASHKNEVKLLNKSLKDSSNKLDKLIKLVQHNAKNSESILKQLG